MILKSNSYDKRAWNILFLTEGLVLVAMEAMKFLWKAKANFRNMLKVFYPFKDIILHSSSEKVTSN